MAGHGSPDKSRLVQVTIKVPAGALEAYDAAAASANLSRHRWMCLVLDSAAGVSELPRQLMRIVEHIPPKTIRDGNW